MKIKRGKTVIRLIQGDLTEMETEAIVNAANSYLAHGGGVAGAIVRKGGQSIQEESDILLMAKGGIIPTGSAVITAAGELPCKYVIHTVGPRMGDGEEDRKLESATLAALETAASRKIKTIAFPAISTGIFGYPMDRCAEVMLTAALDFTAENQDLREIIFCLYDKEALELFTAALKKLK